ncbi:phosphate ABC transporter substrate-binding protein PstS [Nonomuraea angiospora]|uniref:Phosphate-binding protein n=1 Tax=Nonomuraea angiospora TaxID=46172 RepID=A0ABR9M3L5_9ACTN|nr:phosphate ABC transporter substrate-binding protein PstS [Nonomuraea angiospora]MBE1587459.1 phosphate transport system substrate-binding protein [Nonomuraea angiospora]MDX3110167.1 phosphate ABC transporter substrate-binding protein PstS [Nonomuraea angiospora]
MKYAGRLAAVAVVGALSLAACGTDNNAPAGSTTSASAPAAGNDNGLSGTINAAGSSAQANAITEWTKNFTATNPGVTLNYQPSGSGAGVQAFIQGTVAFAGSDSALKDDQPAQADARCKTGKAINIPMVTGPIAVVYNLPGVEGLQLSPKTLGGIFDSKITKWDDAAIKADNPSAKLPSTPIQAFHRSDESGTSDNFTKFLKATAGWAYEPAKAWPAEAKGQGAKGSDGIASSVKDTEGAISYVELSYAENSSLQKAKVANGANEFVELTPESAAKTVETATVKGTGNDLALSIDYATKTPGAYPIVLVTYEITCEKGLSAEETKLVKGFLTYTASDEGQAALKELGYAPLAGDLLTKVRTAVEAIS